MKQQWVKYSAVSLLLLGLCWLILRPREQLIEPLAITKAEFNSDENILVQTVDTANSHTIYTASVERAELYSDMVHEHVQTDIINRHQQRVDESRYLGTRDREARAHEMIKDTRSFQLRTREAERDHVARLTEAQQRLEYKCLMRNVDQLEDAIENLEKMRRNGSDSN